VQTKIDQFEMTWLRAAEQYLHQRASAGFLNIIWYVAEMRQDMPDLPSFLALHNAAIQIAVGTGNGRELSRILREIIMGAVLPHVTNSTAADMQMRLALLESESGKTPLRIFLSKAADVWRTVLEANAKAGGLGVSWQFHDQKWQASSLDLGAHASISFKRTLRVPEDGKEYPLPADMGTLPIYRVEDYADKVPPHWLKDGGFFIPLYQREALFIAFKGAAWRPTAAKVAVGRINAITGKPYDERIRPHEQDYVVVPDQKWLDGINTGKNVVSQFVAMPLGEGYSIEEQLTDEAEHGGFQIVVFEPHAELFPLECPLETERRKDHARQSAHERRIRLKQDSFISRLDPQLRLVAEAFQAGDISELSWDPDALERLLQHVRALMLSMHGPECLEGWEDDNISDFADRLREEEQFYEEPDLAEESGLAPTPAHAGNDALYSAPAGLSNMLCSAPARRTEMGIARGGSIKQQIFRDHYGVKSWNEAAKRAVNIRIVNSAVFEEITGEPPPETPVTAAAYSNSEIPWFDYYDESLESVAPASKLAAVKNIRTIAAIRGESLQDEQEPKAVDPGLIKRIHTPTRDERIASFLKRSEACFKAKRFELAYREATLALELARKSGSGTKVRRSALMLRASCSNKLERFYEAEADATELIDDLEDDAEPLAARAYSYLRREDYDLAIADATEAIKTNTSCLLAREVKAESFLWIDANKEAYAEATQALEIQPRSGPALLVRGECLRRMGYMEYAIADLNLALTFGGPDAVVYATRAEALVALGRIDEAKRDLKLSLDLIPHYEFARNLLAQIT